VKKLVQLATISVLIYSSVLAGGFQLNEQGARAMSMGGAFAGLANDPSALYFNPAGITQLKGTNFYFGGTLIMPLGSYKVPGSKDVSAEQIAQTYTPVNFYMTHAFSEDLSIGLSFNNQYGLGTKWDANWVGRYLAVNTQVQTYQGTLAVAYKVLDNLSISAGAVYGFTDVTIENKKAVVIQTSATTSLSLGDVSPSMEGDGSAFGFTAGVLYKPFDNFQVGVSYRSEIAYDLSGTVVTTPNVLSVGSLTIPIPSQNIEASLTTPQNITFGVAYMPQNNLTLTADFQFVGWSSYDKLEILNSDTGAKISSVVRDYKDTYIARAGIEYVASDAFTLRGGVLYDHNPVKDELVEPTLPDADRIGLTIGYGAKIGNLGIDVGYFFLMFMDREVKNSTFGLNGTYSMTAHLLGVDLSYSL
jgi:long-chain fatty acid transport protein